MHVNQPSRDGEPSVLFVSECRAPCSPNLPHFAKVRLPAAPSYWPQGPRVLLSPSALLKLAVLFRFVPCVAFSCWCLLYFVVEKLVDTRRGFRPSMWKVSCWFFCRGRPLVTVVQLAYMPQWFSCGSQGVHFGQNSESLGRHSSWSPATASLLLSPSSTTVACNIGRTTVEDLVISGYFLSGPVYWDTNPFGVVALVVMTRVHRPVPTVLPWTEPSWSQSL